MLEVFCTTYANTLFKMRFVRPGPPLRGPNHIKTEVFNIAKMTSIAAEEPEKPVKHNVFEHRTQNTL